MDLMLKIAAGHALPQRLLSFPDGCIPAKGLVSLSIIVHEILKDSRMSQWVVYLSSVTNFTAIIPFYLRNIALYCTVLKVGDRGSRVCGGPAHGIPTIIRSLEA